MKAKRPTRTQLTKKADTLFSLLIRKRGKCEHCGKTDHLQCAHVITRSNRNLRWNEDNALCLCNYCHIFWNHKEPLEFAEWYKTNYPIRYAFLMREKNKVNPDLGSTIEFTIQELTERLKEV
jgi:hypothetical protein